MLRFWLLPLLLLLADPSPAAAEIYRWVAANGTITFRDTPLRRSASASA